MAWITNIPFSIGKELSSALKVKAIIKAVPESCVSWDTFVTKKMKPHFRVFLTELFRWWRICLQRRRPRFDLWVRKIPWRMNDCPHQNSCLENPMNSESRNPVFLPGEFHKPCGLQSMRFQRVGHDWMTEHTMYDQLNRFGGLKEQKSKTEVT